MDFDISLLELFSIMRLEQQVLIFVDGEEIGYFHFEKIPKKLFHMEVTQIASHGDTIDVKLLSRKKYIGGKL